MDNKALYRIGYGLYVLTAREGGKDNGCIVNTVMQVTSDPLRLVVAVNHANYTNGMIARTGKFNVSVLNENVTFDVFKRFGFASGKDTDKFEGFGYARRGENDVLYADAPFVNAVFECGVTDMTEFSTHTLFIAEPTNAFVLNDAPTCTYDYYRKNVKPAPQPVVKGKTVWRCTICGYEYEGDELPEGFVCPLCKHPASDFVKVIGDRT